MPPLIRPSSVDEFGDAVRQVIRAYHGSAKPDHFDRFDSKFIGTGEGNQSFGYGHYVAENPDVQADYRRKLSSRKLKDDFLHRLPEDAAPEEVLDDIGHFDPRQQKFLQELHNNEWLGFDYPSQGIDQSMRAGGLRDYDATNELIDARKNLGTGYEVDVHIPRNSMLDWDAPLVSQKEKLQRVWDAIRSQWSRENEAALRAGSRSPVPLNAEDILIDMQRNPAYTGQSLWHTAVGAHGGRNYGEKWAAEMLHDAGIPGISYLDQGSRAAGVGTKNHVIFPGAEDQIRILRKFAVPGVVGAGAAAMGGED